ncbi:amphi-Trp domain-containing protein [Natronorubrum tibetense]|uniref:Amphi-Trp domain-containing protein n=1 Tax=Natronorubrum tibetense GA33 TaxID=1114856 RepID=L9W9R7_9EURY|nr:amphi-Trp domain-containing protein [Natronorubrum tibetense]ELY46209.1 hypothetical protein C496_01541 [Natronorubrum tibetense GA33]
MVEKTRSADELSRDEAAEHLRALADELEDGDQATIRTGNKAVDLRPPESIAYEVGIIERSSLLRGQRETVTLKMGWKPPSVSEEAE